MFSQAQTMLFLIIIPFLTYGAKYVFNIQLSHLLNIETFGDFSLGLKMLSVCSYFVLLGTASSAKRFLSDYLQHHDTASSLDYIHWNLRLITKLSVVFIGLLAALILTMITLHVFNVKHIATYHLTFYLLFLTPLSALAILIPSYLQCNNNTISSNLFSQGGMYILFAVLLALIPYLYSGAYNNTALWVLSLTVWTLLVLAEIIAMIYYFPRSLLKGIYSLSKHKPIAAHPAWKRTARNLIFNQLLFLVVCAADLFAVKLCTNDPNAVGRYSAVLTIAGLTWLLNSSIYSSLSSSVSYLLKENKADLQSLVNRLNLANLVLNTLAILGTIYWGRTLLNSFGPHYATDHTYMALVIVSVGYYLGSFTSSATSLISYSGNEIYLVYGAICELVTIVLSAGVLTYFYGIIGAAIASSLTITIKSVGYITTARKVTGIKSLSMC